MIGTNRISRLPAKARNRAPRYGEANKLNKRSEVSQAQRGYAEENVASDENEEFAVRGKGLNEPSNPKRTKAGR